MCMGDVIVLLGVVRLVILAVYLLKNNKNSCAGCAHAGSCVIRERSKCHVLEDTGH